MTDNKQSESNAVETNFAIQRIYVKDMSFETPNVPHIFSKEWTPEVNVELNNASNVLADDVYEVALRITVITKIKEEIAYVCEVTQAGIFSISGFEEAQLQNCLGAFCPNILFPYIRESISNLINKGTFPPLNLEPINFDALYMNHIAQQHNAKANGSDNLQ